MTARPRHRICQLTLGQTMLKVSSDFDSGSMQSAQLRGNRVIITPALDPMHPQYSLKPSSKTFFHFSLEASQAITVTVAVTRVKILEYFASAEQFQEYYRPCVGTLRKGKYHQSIDYKKVKLDGLVRVDWDTGYELQFRVSLEPNQLKYVAYHFPYPYERTLQHIEKIKQVAFKQIQSGKQDIYFKNQLLIESLQGRAVNLITLTASNQISEETESRVSKSLFPYFDIESRPMKFNKPYVMITCRVHPGQTSASFALQGLLQFLLSEDERAVTLRRSFVFIVIPLLNPDGVYHGTYRMDTLGHNLNRFYNASVPHKQPSIFAAHTIAQYYSSRLLFFMDIHSHPHPNKGAFIYGNSHNCIEEQTESQLYAKLLSLQSQSFGYQWCNFSNSQMNSRDANQTLTKDGSARVQMYKLLNIPFVFTMEMGYHGCPIKTKTEQYEHFGKDYKRTSKIFEIDDYKQHGKSIVVSLLNIFQLASGKNPKLEGSKSIPALREQVCREIIQKEDKFRQMDGFVFKKIRQINEINLEMIYQQIFKKFPTLQAQITLPEVASKPPLPFGSLKSIEVAMEKKKALSQKEGSLRKRPLKNISKTIETVSLREKQFRSYKSIGTEKLRAETTRWASNFEKKQKEKFTKLLNLNFNPFPESEKRKLYSSTEPKQPGSAQPAKIKREPKKVIASSLEPFDIDYVAVSSQMQIAEKNFRSVGRDDDIFHNRMRNFNRGVNTPDFPDQEEIDLVENECLAWQVEVRDQSHKIALPKITTKASKMPQHFGMELDLHKQYDKKYNIHGRVSESPSKPPPLVHRKASIRSNGLKIKSPIVPFQ